MPFKHPSWVPDLPIEPPDSISIPDFMLYEKYGRHPLADSRTPFICGISGKAPSVLAVKQQVEYLSRGLAAELGWKVDDEELSKVACIFSVNTIDYVPLTWAIHSLGAVITPANAQYSSSDLAHQLKDSRVSCLFTCYSLLSTAIQAAEEAGIPNNRIYILEVPGSPATNTSYLRFTTIDQLLQLGEQSSNPKVLEWTQGEGKRRTAFICYSSGTSGLSKGVLISHYNVISNIIQVYAFEQKARDQLQSPTDILRYTENVLGFLPLSHIYGLVLIAHCSVWRGDSVVILPKFDFKPCLEAIQRHQIRTLFLVPPVIVLMTKNLEILRQYDLSSVRAIFSGAAPLGREIAEQLEKSYPNWLIRQGYGLTETCVVVSSSADFDIWFGSSGSLIPGVQVKVVRLDGKEVTEYGQTGELWVKSPSLVLGYLNNEKSNREAFITDENGNRWMRTGDEVMFKKAPSGNEHLFIVDRIKELIKVKGFQVAPAELEAHLLRNPHVVDCAVIPVSDNDAGEVPKAYVAKSQTDHGGKSDDAIAEEIVKYVAEHKSRHKWLTGGVEFVDSIPKSPSGKILRRLLRDKERLRRRNRGTRL